MPQRSIPSELPAPFSSVTASGAVPAPHHATTPPRPDGPGIPLVAAIALLAGLVIAALWVVASVATGLVLPELAVLIGAAAGLVVRRSPRAGGAGAAVAAGLVALVAIALGLLFATLAVYSSARGLQAFFTAVGGLGTGFLPHLESEAGVLGAALGAGGVIVAVMVTLPERRDSGS